MFMVGIAVFAASSLLGGLAQDQIWLIVSRGFQGVGAAIAAPTALSLIAANFPEGQARNRAFGVYAAMSGGGGAVGLLLGGILTDLVSWRWIFFVNVPIAAVVLFMAPRALNESDTTTGRLDVPGAVTATGGMVALVYALANASTHGWSSPGTLGPLAAAVVLLVAFGILESRTTGPLMPLRIFANRNRSAAYAIMLCVATAILSMFFFLTQYLQNVLGWSPIKTGVGFLPMTAGIIIAAGLTSRLIDRIGIRIPLLFGPTAMFIGLAWLSRLTVTSGYLDILGPLVLMPSAPDPSSCPSPSPPSQASSPARPGWPPPCSTPPSRSVAPSAWPCCPTVAIDATKSRLHTLTAAHGHLSASAGAVATTHGYTTAFEVSAGIALAGLVISLLAIRAPRPTAGPGIADEAISVELAAVVA